MSAKADAANREAKAANPAIKKLLEIAADLPAKKIAEVVEFAEFIRAKHQNQQAKKNDKPRIAGLNRGTILMSEDFADPLPDDFWNFNKDDDFTYHAPKTENK